MHILLAALGLIAIVCFYILRTRRAVDAVRELNSETKQIQHKARGAISAMIGTPLGRVRDPALAAAVLMVQLARSDGAMAAEEKAAILARLADPIGAADPQGLFARAWGLTAQDAFFSQVSDEVTPLLKGALSEEEKSDLIGILRSVAEAGGGASDLQRSSIARLAKRLSN